jgi:hypothetical protein
MRNACAPGPQGGATRVIQPPSRIGTQSAIVTVGLVDARGAETLRGPEAGIGTQAFGAPEADVAISPHRHHTTNVRLSKLAVTLGGYAGQCCPPIVSIKAPQPIVSRCMRAVC